MITVRLYGLLRLESGIKEMVLEAKNVKHLLEKLETETAGSLRAKDLRNGVIMVNGKTGTVRTKLSDGDIVLLLSPVAGG